MWLTLAEGGRRHERGDMAGAWECYRAVLRVMAHVRRRESLIDRRVVNIHCASLRNRLATWAVDPRTTIPQLRCALDTVLACQPRREWDAFTLKIQYLDLMRFLEQPDTLRREHVEEVLTYRVGELQLPTDWAMQLYGVQRQSSARARTQSPCHPAPFRQLACPGGQLRPAATQAGRAGEIPRSGRFPGSVRSRQ